MSPSTLNDSFKIIIFMNLLLLLFVLYYYKPGYRCFTSSSPSTRAVSCVCATPAVLWPPLAAVVTFSIVRPPACVIARGQRAIVGVCPKCAESWPAGTAVVTLAVVAPAIAIRTHT
jgi:hypothetical protein